MPLDEVNEVLVRDVGAVARLVLTVELCRFCFGHLFALSINCLINSGLVGDGSIFARSASTHARRSGSNRTPTSVDPTLGRPRFFLLSDIVSLMRI